MLKMYMHDVLGVAINSVRFLGIGLISPRAVVEFQFEGGFFMFTLV